MSCEPVAHPVALPFRVGARTVARVTRQLVQVPVALGDALAGVAPVLPPLADAADGYFIRAMPATMLAGIAGGGLRPIVRQAYPRHYARLDQSFETYLAGFSAKSRSGLKRKRRRLEERCGGALDVRLYRRPDEMTTFFGHARAVSALTYQEKLLDAGLPLDALPGLRALAQRDAVRAWLLFVDARPVAYLYAPAQGDTLLYAHLGYNPAFAELSPGSMLQLEAMRMVMEEGQFRWFDFTEGDGQHKRQLATDSIDSVDLLLLRPNFANLAAARALGAFDRAVAMAKNITAGAGLRRLARAARR